MRKKNLTPTYNRPSCPLGSCPNRLNHFRAELVCFAAAAKNDKQVNTGIIHKNTGKKVPSVCTSPYPEWLLSGYVQLQHPGEQKALCQLYWTLTVRGGGKTQTKNKTTNQQHLSGEGCGGKKVTNPSPLSTAQRVAGSGMFYTRATASRSLSSRRRGHGSAKCRGGSFTQASVFI